jgi:hypothetical protein
MLTKEHDRKKGDEHVKYRTCMSPKALTLQPLRDAWPPGHRVSSSDGRSGLTCGLKRCILHRGMWHGHVVRFVTFTLIMLVGSMVFTWLIMLPFWSTIAVVTLPCGGWCFTK